MPYAICAAAMIVMGFIIYRQQRTIDNLTNKLMARDYKEYVSMQPKEAVQEPLKKRKPMSWYDDADIDDEEAVN